MSIEEPRRPLSRQRNPEATIGESRESTRQALQERLAALSACDRLAELEMIGGVLFNETANLSDTELEPAESTTLSGLKLALYKKAHRLEARRVLGI
jgi:hypothetical protein